MTDDTTAVGEQRLVGWLVLVDDQVIVRDRQTEKCHEKVSAAVAKVSIEMMIFMYIISL